MTRTRSTRRSARAAATTPLLAAMLAAGPAAADEGGPNFTFGASVSYTYDFNDPDNQSTGENFKTYSNGESEESVNVDLVQIGASGTRGPVSYGAKIDLGDWSRAVGDDIDGDIALQEMFLAIDTGPVLVSAGRMPTPLGFEVVEPWANPNISRSRAWTFQSISHDGVVLSGEAGGINLAAGVINGFRLNDPVANNADDEYGVLASVGVPVAQADLRVTAVYSEENDTEQMFELNANLAGNHDNVRYGLDTTWLSNPRDGINNTQEVWDVTLYGGATFGSWSTDLRFGYTDEQGTNANFVAASSSVGTWSFTATGGYEITDGVVVRAEYRGDGSDGDIFDDGSGAGGNEDMVHTLQFQLLWTPATGGD